MVAADTNMKFAFIYPGQGSQFIGMGKEFYENSTAKAMFENASDVLKIDFKKLLFEQNDKLEQTQWTQPAIFLVSAIAFNLFKQEFSIKPEFALGHSLGEFSALFSANALSFEYALVLVHNRGLLMQEASVGKTASMMAVLGLSDEILEDFCQTERKNDKQIYTANYNTDGQVVLAGLKEDLENAAQKLKDLGAKRALLLNMSVSSHCPLLDSICEPFSKLLESSLQDNFSHKIISNVTAQAYSDKNEALELLTKQLIMPVLYKQSIAKFASSVDVFVEFGAEVLKGLNKRICKNPTFCIKDLKTLEETLTKLKEME